MENSRSNCVILDSRVLLEKRGLENQLSAPQPTLHRRCCVTRGTTGPWTCGAPGSSSTSPFREPFHSMRMKIFMSKFKMHLLCILLIHGKKFPVERSSSSQICFRLKCESVTPWTSPWCTPGSRTTSAGVTWGTWRPGLALLGGSLISQMTVGGSHMEGRGIFLMWPKKLLEYPCKSLFFWKASWMVVSENQLWYKKLCFSKPLSSPELVKQDIVMKWPTQSYSKPSLYLKTLLLNLQSVIQYNHS